MIRRTLGTLATMGIIALTACSQDTTAPQAQPTPRFDTGSPAYLMATALSTIWATNVDDSGQGVRIDGSCVRAIRSDPMNALGAPDFTGDPDAGDWFSLGMISDPQYGTDSCPTADPQNGWITVSFGQPVGGGLVFVAEATFQRPDYPDETVDVFAHKVGDPAGSFTKVGTASGLNDPTSFALPEGMCFDQVKVVNTIDAATYEGALDVAGLIASNDPAIPDGFDVDAIGAEGPCSVDLGCTLTQGYWKNHEDSWPAGYDPGDPFIGSGQNWLEVLQTPPKKGNEYYILAHQYIAAVLNGAKGAATTSDVDAALAGAEDYFDGSSSPSRDQVIAWASTLDEYNNGLAPGGPPHCGD